MNALRIVVAECSVDYTGRLSAHLPRANRLLMLQADGEVLIHADGARYKPLNWRSPPATVHADDPTEEEAALEVEAVWRVVLAMMEGQLRILLVEIEADHTFDLRKDAGLIK